MEIASVPVALPVTEFLKSSVVQIETGIFSPKSEVEKLTAKHNPARQNPSQYKETQYYCKFTWIFWELQHSENFGKDNYSDTKLHCDLVFTLTLAILCSKVKFQKIAERSSCQPPQWKGCSAGFLPKFCHSQNSWLLPREQGQACSETAHWTRQNGLVW